MHTINKHCYFLKVFILISASFLGKGSKLSGQTARSFSKGSFYFYWGYNRDYYGPSDIKFKGDDYQFTLHHVRASDRQSKLAADPYLHIDQLTIPQYNYRLGYCFSDKYSISFGFDHMKYVMNQGQTVQMDGYINRPGNPYSGVYNAANMELKGDFLEFEHTDGLNYLNVELSRSEQFAEITSGVRCNLIYGSSVGVLYPRTRAVLLNTSINDQWHISGYGLAVHNGINIGIGKHWFIQGVSKGGFINMPDIVTTSTGHDKAKQHFAFLQNNLVLGYTFDLKK